MTPQNLQSPVFPSSVEDFRAAVERVMDRVLEQQQIDPKFPAEIIERRGDTWKVRFSNTQGYIRMIDRGGFEAAFLMADYPLARVPAEHAAQLHLWALDWNFRRGIGLVTLAVVEGMIVLLATRHAGECVDRVISELFMRAGTTASRLVNELPAEFGV